MKERLKGKFKGWRKEKEFGLIAVDDDDNHDVIVFKKDVEEPDKMIRGSLLTFTLRPRKIGFKAWDVEIAGQSPVGKVHQGWIQNWVDGKYGFITNETGGEWFLHSTALPDSENGYPVGLLVEFHSEQGKRGPEAHDIKVVGWKGSDDVLINFADLGGQWATQLEELAGWVEDPLDSWSYKHAAESESLPVLRSYIRYTFQRLHESSEGIMYTDKRDFAAFNTGLVTPHREEIYGLFRSNDLPGRQEWKFLRFSKKSERIVLNNFGSHQPKLAHYFDDPSVLIYDRRCKLVPDWDHLFDHPERYPEHLRTDRVDLQQRIESAMTIVEWRLNVSVRPPTHSMT